MSADSTRTPAEPGDPGDPGEPDQPGEAERRPARGGIPWKRLILGGVLVAVLVLGIGAFWLVRQIDPPGAPGEPVAVEVPEGSSAGAIADLLEERDVITSARVFRLYVRLTGASGFQAGIYGKGEFREQMSMGDAVSVLRSGPEITYARLTIPEGLTLEQIADRAGQVEWIDRDEFHALATSGEIRSKYQPEGVDTLEGLLFPDTYMVAEDEDAAALLRRMVDLFDQVAERAGVASTGGGQGLSPYETIVLASLVEEETKVADERPLVAAVIYNRLDRGMLLQIDATVIYALGEHVDRVLFRHLEIDSPYNTYQNPGLPPTPIAAPGESSLAAAAGPADADFLFYVKTDESGRHAFAETAAEHERNVADARRRGVI